MKNLSLSYLKNLKFSSTILLFILVAFSACKKEEEIDTTLSNIRVINAAPTLATYYPFINSGLISSAALPYGGSTAYNANISGANTIKFTAENNTESLLTKTVNLNANNYYSFYLIITLTAGYHYDIICGGLVSPANDTERAINLVAVMLK
ncbi:MAG: DUF4397 domain-containing protein [Pedobacter sp.]|nr:MAG: DUF4397 domain-containing protein [Pedobacter sp.]